MGTVSVDTKDDGKDVFPSPFPSVLQVCSSMFCESSPYIRISIVHTAKIGIRQCLKDHEVVAYKRLKPMENPNSGRSRLQEVVVY